jgi:transcriptional regulator with XRE-family HTH domain
MGLGARVRKRREALGLSQQALGEMADLTQPSLSDIEREVQPDITTAVLKRLALALGCTTDYLVGMHEEEPMKLRLIPRRQRGRPRKLVGV